VKAPGPDLETPESKQRHYSPPQARQMTREGKVGASNTTPPPPAPALLLRYCSSATPLLHTRAKRHYEGGAVRRPTVWGFGIIILQVHHSTSSAASKQASADAEKMFLLTEKWFQLRSFSWGNMPMENQPVGER
jgi:hypothetical protein